MLQYFRYPSDASLHHKHHLRSLGSAMLLGLCIEEMMLQSTRYFLARHYVWACCRADGLSIWRMVRLAIGWMVDGWRASCFLGREALWEFGGFLSGRRVRGRLWFRSGQHGRRRPMVWGDSWHSFTADASFALVWSSERPCVQGLYFLIILFTVVWTVLKYSLDAWSIRMSPFACGSARTKRTDSLQTYDLWPIMSVVSLIIQIMLWDVRSSSTLSVRIKQFFFL